MLKRLAVAVAASVLLSNSLCSIEKSFEVAGDCVKYADENYANKSLKIEDRKNIMDEMVAAADKFADNYDVQWRAAQAIYVYADMLYFQYQVENYEAALAKNKIKDTDDVMCKSLDLSGEQSKSLLGLGVTARKYADKAVEINPEGVEGQYYNSMGIATYAFGKSIVKALLEGLGTKYQEHLDKAISVNKDYQDGILYTAYGRYWYKLPWPKKSLKKSLASLITAEKYNPENMMALDYLGDTLFAEGKKEEAVISWEKVLVSTHKTYQAEYIRKLVTAKLQYAKK
jgi:tetratricopeptide (TPR) repeat protein